MTPHPVVGHEAWLAARRTLLAKEKELTHMRDQLSEQRRALAWERVERAYELVGPDGRVALAELFQGKSQLVVYHFMYGPAPEQQPCKSCSFWADNFERITVHLAHRDVRLIAVSRAPLAKLQAFARRMQWTFPWYSSGDSGFNQDFAVSFEQDQVAPEQMVYNFGTSRAYGSEMPGVSVFYRDDAGAVFHTYSCYARGIDALNVAYQYLDLVPKGRDEAPPSQPMAWLRLRDEY